MMRLGLTLALVLLLDFASGCVGCGRPGDVCADHPPTCDGDVFTRCKEECRGSDSKASVRLCSGHMISRDCKSGGLEDFGLEQRCELAAEIGQHSGCVDVDAEPCESAQESDTRCKNGLIQACIPTQSGLVWNTQQKCERCVRVDNDVLRCTSGPPCDPAAYPMCKEDGHYLCTQDAEGEFFETLGDRCDNGCEEVFTEDGSPKLACQVFSGERCFTGVFPWCSRDQSSLFLCEERADGLTYVRYVPCDDGCPSCLNRALDGGYPTPGAIGDGGAPVLDAAQSADAGTPMVPVVDDG
jgi:hypothetical protein